MGRKNDGWGSNLEVIPNTFIPRSAGRRAELMASVGPEVKLILQP